MHTSIGRCITGMSHREFAIHFSSYVDRTYHDAVPRDLPVCFLWKKMIFLFRETKVTVTPREGGGRTHSVKPSCINVQKVDNKSLMLFTRSL